VPDERRDVLASRGVCAEPKTTERDVEVTNFIELGMVTWF
jgi:hypothetical protein